MSIYIGNPKVEILDYCVGGRAVVRLLEDWVVEFCILDAHYCITVPRGTVSDGASIPRFFHRLLPPGEYWREAIIHDYLYAIGWPRRLADETMWQVMHELGRSPWKRELIFFGLRLFGWRAYREHARRREGKA